MISGVPTPYLWDAATRRWNPMAQAAVAAPPPIVHAQVVPATSVSGVTTTTGTGTAATSVTGAAETRASIANMQQQLQQTFTNLLNNIPE